MAQTREKIGCEKCDSRMDGIFCDLKVEELFELSKHKVTNTYKKGQNLFFQGNPPFGIFCINSGKVKVTKVGADGKEAIVRVAKNGDILGHRSLFSEEYYSATSTALEDSTICFLDKKWIMKAIEEKPSVAKNLIGLLSRDMGAAEQKLASMSQKNVRERLAELLLTLKNTFGIKENNIVRLNIKLTREELASMIGVANETLIRFLSEFRDEGIITQKGKVIYIADEEKLLEFANIPY